MRIQSFVKSAVLFAALAIVLAGCFGPTLPVAVLTAPIISGAAPLEVAFDLSYSFHPDNEPISYSLDFGDGSDPATGTDFDVILHYTYEVGGSYLAVLVVSDVHGNQASDSLVITVDDNGPPVGIELGNTAPDFTGHLTTGGEISLYDYHGQVILLEFWGAWCSACQESMPRLDDLTRAYADQGLVTITVSTDALEQDTIDFLTSGGYDDFISVWEAGGKYNNPIDVLYDVSLYPTTFLLDRQGVIRYIGVPTYLSDEDIESLL